MAGAKKNRKTQFELPLRNRRDGIAIRIPRTPAISVCGADQRLDSRPDCSHAGSAWAADSRTRLRRSASIRFSESRTRDASIGDRTQARGTWRHGIEGAAITVPGVLELGSTRRMAPALQAARSGCPGGRPAIRKAPTAAGNLAVAISRNCKGGFVRSSLPPRCRIDAPRRVRRRAPGNRRAEG